MARWKEEKKRKKGTSKKKYRPWKKEKRGGKVNENIWFLTFRPGMASSKVTPCSCYSGKFYREKNKLQDTRYLSAKIFRKWLLLILFSHRRFIFPGSFYRFTTETSNTILSPFWLVKKLASCSACINGGRFRRFTKGEDSFCLNELLFIQRKFWYEHDYQHRFK